MAVQARNVDHGFASGPQTFEYRAEGFRLDSAHDREIEIFISEFRAGTGSPHREGWDVTFDEPAGGDGDGEFFFVGDDDHYRTFHSLLLITSYPRDRKSP